MNWSRVEVWWFLHHHVWFKDKYHLDVPKLKLKLDMYIYIYLFIFWWIKSTVFCCTLWCTWQDETLLSQTTFYQPKRLGEWLLYYPSHLIQILNNKVTVDHYVQNEETMFRKGLEGTWSQLTSPFSVYVYLPLVLLVSNFFSLIFRKKS